MKRKAFAALCVFTVAMICFGILARAVDTNGVALVKTTTASTQTLAPSATEYRTCIPLEALYQESPSQYYVLVLEEQAGFLGSELIVRKVSVNVLEQDEHYAALNDGSLSSQQNVVVRSDKVVAEGDKARESDA